MPCWGYNMKKDKNTQYHEEIDDIFQEFKEFKSIIEGRIIDTYQIALRMQLKDLNPNKKKDEAYLKAWIKEAKKELYELDKLYDLSQYDF